MENIINKFTLEISYLFLIWLLFTTLSFKLCKIILIENNKIQITFLK